MAAATADAGLVPRPHQRPRLPAEAVRRNLLASRP